MAAPSEVNGLPGYYWYYQPDHGLRGRHAFNPSTGVAIPYRQVTYIRNGSKTEQQVINQLSRPIKGSLRKRYKVLVFSNLYGAWRYAATASSPSYILAYGTPYALYEDEPALTYRALFGTTSPSQHMAKGVFAYYHELDRLMQPAENRGFVVWQLL